KNPHNAPQRSKEKNVRNIMEKFRPAIPERRLVLVALQNEFRPAAKSITLPEVLRHAAHQKIGPPSCAWKNPFQHRCGRGLPMRAANHNGMPPRQKHFL